MAVLGLHRMHPVCMPAGGQAREGLGGSSHPQFWWARLQRPDLSPTAPRSPEQVQQYLFDLSTYHFPRIHSCPSFAPIQEATQT